ncbi:MAG: hypothetical protein LBS32_03360 [Clostridiales Family XIII bacterium]|jgi:hypothetical protein|nr:hypothetical protein [Clostridiales Family XIII bacterium]
MTAGGAQGYLGEGYALMEEFGFEPPPAEERDGVAARAMGALGGDASADRIAAAFLSFFISRRLCEAEGGRDGARVLLSDYFVSLAVKLLLPLESEWLLGEMSAQMKKRAGGGARLLEKLGMDEYFDFIDRACRLHLEHSKA